MKRSCYWLWQLSRPTRTRWSSPKNRNGGPFEQETRQTISTGAVHAALQRLEQKGYLRSELGEATPERGGRRKRLFTVTALGGRVLSDVRAVRNRLWDRIVPGTILKWS